MSRDDARTYLLYAVLIIGMLFMLFYMKGPPALETSQQRENYASRYLPAGATNIQKRGKYWVQFELDGVEYLFFRKEETYGASSAITRK